MHRRHAFLVEGNRSDLNCSLCEGLDCSEPATVSMNAGELRPIPESRLDFVACVMVCLTLEVLTSGLLSGCAYPIVALEVVNGPRPTSSFQEPGLMLEA